MKAPINDPKQEAQDLLYFEYLEGELSSEESSALEQDLAANPALMEELESWKETYIVQDFYETELLEGKLLSANQVPDKFTFSTSLNVVVLAVMTTLLSFMLITDESQERLRIFPEASTHAAVEEAVPEKAEEAEERESQIRLKKEGIENVKAKANKARKVDEQPNGMPEGLEEEEFAVSTSTNHKESAANMSSRKLPTSIESLPREMDNHHLGDLLSETEVKPVPILQKQKAPKISRKQQRMIEKKIDKALQERKAREYMKGNIPYVVPLNSQNF